VIAVDEHSCLVIVERGDAGFGAWRLTCPGCVAVGDTLEEAEREMREARFIWTGCAKTVARFPCRRLRTWR
jgi:predicted RNase H-like HicB family nuclease